MQRGTFKLLESGEFIERLGWTRQALSNALKAKRIFFIEAHSERYFPLFFTESQHERRHFEAVSKLLRKAAEQSTHSGAEDIDGFGLSSILI